MGNEVDVMEKVKKKKSLWERPALNAHDKAIALEKFAELITDDINEWIGVPGFPSKHVSHVLDNSNSDRCYLITSVDGRDTLIVAIIISFNMDDTNKLNIIISPKGHSNIEYSALFTYLKKKIGNIRKYALVKFNREDAELTLQFAERDLD
jgi:hypothetical protein